MFSCSYWKRLSAYTTKLKDFRALIEMMNVWYISQLAYHALICKLNKCNFPFFARQRIGGGSVVLLEFPSFLSTISQSAHWKIISTIFYYSSLHRVTCQLFPSLSQSPSLCWMVLKSLMRHNGYNLGSWQKIWTTHPLRDS